MDDDLYLYRGSPNPDDAGTLEPVCAVWELWDAIDETLALGRVAALALACAPEDELTPAVARDARAARARVRALLGLDPT